MNLLFDISVLGRGHLRPRDRAGVFRVVENLACRLAASRQVELTFSAGWQLQAALEYLESHPDLAGVPLPHSESQRRLYRRLKGGCARVAGCLPALASFAERGGLDRLAAAIVPRIDRLALARADIFHSPFHPLPPRVRRESKAQRFLTVHDLIPVLHPQFCGRRFRRLFDQILSSLDEDSWVLVNSQATKEDLCAYRGIDPARVFVTHWAADAKVFHRERDEERIRSTCRNYGIPDAPYILSVGTFEPRKNVDHVIRCFAELSRVKGADDLHLVLVGARGWDDARIFQEISAQPGLRDRIVVTGYVADADLAPLYSGALAFVYMSHYEGFGLPVLEAMQCGVPVITSRTSSLPEVVHNAGILLDPVDRDGLCQAVLDLYRRPSRRAKLTALALQQAQHFSWERCVQDTLAAYRTGLSGGIAESCCKEELEIL